MRSSVKRVFKQFLSTTTLHGFKYLNSPYILDRVVWVMCCCASACCAGVLCTVLWARFIEVPALLSLVAPQTSPQSSEMRAPYVAICISPERMAQLFEQALTLPKHKSVYLPNVFTQIIRSKPIDGDILEFLERVLQAKNLTLTAALTLVTPSCGELIVKCRWMKKQDESCEQLFRKALTAYGLCCVARVDRLRYTYTKRGQLDLVLNCSSGGVANGCELLLKYPGEPPAWRTAVSTGYYYRAHFSSLETLDSNQEKLLDSQCVPDPAYTTFKCIWECKERGCGCSTPFRMIADLDPGVLPPCPLLRLNCLRRLNVQEECGCRQACKKTLTNTVLENGRLDLTYATYDPLFAGVKASVHSVISVRVARANSKVFQLWYTETWWSLLSSLGGVFSMFLGVGLCSALEVLSLLLHRLPLALRTR